MFGHHFKIKEILEKRNQNLSQFWFENHENRQYNYPLFAGKEVLIVDAEDTFTKMLAQQLTAMGFIVSVCKFNEPDLLEYDWGLIVMGPGPGDPNNKNDIRIATMHDMIARLFLEKRRFLAVCLSHQILCSYLGLKVICRDTPNQGVQREIQLFDRKERVGFYNTFVAKCNEVGVNNLRKQCIEISMDQQLQEIHALRGETFTSLQFHPESLLTSNSVGILASSIKDIII